MGLGTRAVDRIAGDYPRMINLSHPLLRPDVTPKAIRYYSQHFVDTLDLDKNSMTTVPVELVLGADYYPLRWLVSVDDGETVSTPLSIGRSIDPKQLILTFDGLLQRGPFVPMMKTILTRLQEKYEQPVDVEFAVSLTPGNGRPQVRLPSAAVPAPEPVDCGKPRGPVPADRPASPGQNFAMHAHGAAGPGEPDRIHRPCRLGCLLQTAFS